VKVGTPGFCGERLIEAREARGLTSVGLADILSITSGAITNYEKNRQSPRPEIMQLISEKLNLPVGFFLESGEDVPKRIFFRSLASTTKSARTRASRRLAWLQRISRYVRVYFDLPALNLPQIDLPRNPLNITDDQIEDAAMQCREWFSVGMGPIADLTAILENNGIVVSRGILDAENMDAFCEWDEDVPYIFLGADKPSAVRSRMDAAHELGHLILHRFVESPQLRIPGFHKLLEQQAFRFGSAFLMPTSWLKELWAPTLDAFQALKSRWKVSIAAMISRSEDLGVITADQAQRMWINYNRRQWRKNEPLDDKLLAEEPRLIKRCMELLLEDRTKTREQIVLDLNLNAQDIEQLSGLPRGFLTNTQGDVLVMYRARVDRLSSQTTGIILPFGAPAKR